MTEPAGCGLSKLWFFNGTFQDCCAAHDKAYDELSQVLFEVDKAFLGCMVEKSNSLWYLGAGLGMFGIAHLYGRFFYKGEK